MKNLSTRTVTAALLVAAALTMTACSSSSTSSAAGSSTAAAATTAAASNGFQGNGQNDTKNDQGAKAAPPTTPPNLPKPTAAQLNDEITKAFDPSVPDKEKIGWIENADLDPQLVDKLAAAAKQNGVKITITNVEDPSGGRLKADANVTMNGNPVNGASVPFVAGGTTWKVDHQYACSIVKQAKLNSAACE
jgi:hypothetical protein